MNARSRGEVHLEPQRQSWEQFGSERAGDNRCLGVGNEIIRWFLETDRRNNVSFM